MCRFYAFCKIIAIAAILLNIWGCSRGGNPPDKPSTEFTPVKEQPAETVIEKPSHPIQPSEEEEKEEPEIDYDVKECFEKGVRLFDMESYDDSIGWFSRVIEKDPNTHDAYLFRGIAYYKKGLKSKGTDTNKASYEMDQAVENLTVILKNEPNNVKALEYRGLAHYEKGMHVKMAVRDFTRLIELLPRQAKSHYFRAKANYQGGYVDEAIADFQASIEINPDYTKSYRELWWIIDLKGNYDDALDFYNRLISVHFKNAKPYYYRGLTYYQKGEFSKALQDFNRALMIEPDYPEALEWRQKAEDKMGPGASPEGYSFDL